MEPVNSFTRRNANKSEHKDYRFLRELKRRASSDMRQKVDETTARLHAEAFGIIDCKQCANCCRSMHIRMRYSAYHTN